MNGRQHLAIGAGIGVATAVATAYVDPQLGTDLGVTTTLGRMVMCGVLSPLAGLVIPEEKLKEIVSVVTPKKGIVADVFSKSTKVTTSIILFLLLLGLSYNKYGVITIYSVLGGVIGSLIPDLDSCRSTVNKYMNNMITAGAILLGVGYFLHIDAIVGLFKDGSHHAFIIVFLVLCILGKMSPHREFTHKILGAVCFCATAFMIFPLLFSIAFVLGYISHMMADKTTKAGKQYHPFSISFPCQKSNGEISIEDGIKHLFKSAKVH